MKQKIEAIINARKSRIGKIDERLELLEKLEKGLLSYEKLRNIIVNNNGELKENCPYSSMLLQHPDMVKKIYLANSGLLNGKCSDYRKELERVKNIYSRNSISLLVFGFASSGKSTLIQSITGLGNDVVVACGIRDDGLHVTGASSYIYNSDIFDARVYFYSKEDILRQFNENLESLLKKYNPGVTFQIENFEDIPIFNPELYIPDQKKAASLIIIKENYHLIRNLVTGYDKDSQPLSLSVDEKGRKYLRLSNPQEVKLYVAQHDGNDDIHSRSYFYNYLAVERVDIFSSFPNSEKIGRVVLMDNVGLGDPTNLLATKRTMYQAIADNSDAVILLYKPEENGNWVNRQDDILQQIDALRVKDHAKNEERMDINQLFFLLNDCGINHNDCENCKAWFNGKDTIQKGNRDETCIIVNAKDPADSEKAISDILTQMIEHLPTIDMRMENKLDKAEEEFTRVLSEFVRNVRKVLITTNKNQNIITFDNLFKNLYDGDLRIALDDMLQNAKDNEAQTSADLYKQLMKRSTPEDAEQKVEQADSLIDEQLRKTPWPITAYLNVSAYLRHSIPTDFRRIDTDLSKQIEKRKSEAFKIFYETGLMKRILKKDKKEIDSVKAINLWARKFTETFLAAENYPLLNQLFTNLLEFHQNVDGFLLPRIIKHLDTFTANQPNSIPRGQEKKIIKYYLRVNMTDAIQAIRTDLKGFTNIPNEAIYFALDEFAYGIIYSEQVRTEARKLYANFYESLWEDEANNVTLQQQAFEDWEKHRIVFKDILDYFIND